MLFVGRDLQLCGDGGSLIMCDGMCKRSFHLKCLRMTTIPDEDWVCPDCTSNQMYCLVCNEVGNINEEVFKCKKNNCGRFYHLACIAEDEQIRWFKNREKFICSQHVCRVCNERPGLKPDKANLFLQCIRCPSALHMQCAENKRVSVLTYRSMVCDKHADMSGAPPLDLASVAHIEIPKRKVGRGGGRGRGRGFGWSRKDGDEEYVGGGGGDEDSDGSKTKGKKKGGGKGKAGGAKAGKAGTPVGGAPGLPNSESKEGDDGGADADKKKKRKKKVDPFDYVSEVLGPFKGEGFRLKFEMVQDMPSAFKRAEDKPDHIFCPCQQDLEDQDYIECAQVRRGGRWGCWCWGPSRSQPPPACPLCSAGRGTTYVVWR